MRHAYAFAVLVGVFGAAFFAACNDVSQNQHGTCNVGSLGGLAPDTNACTLCLGANCCDEYGANDAIDGGAQIAADEYKCLLDAGALESPDACIGGAQPPTTSALLTCAGVHCADACQIGSVACTPTPDAPLILTAACDTCVSGACCTALNTCYASRECALAFQCILACTSDAGASVLQTVFSDPQLPDYLTCAQPLACAPGGNGDISPCGQPTSSQQCFGQCVANHSPSHDSGLPQVTECLSLTLFACATNTCLSSCAN